MRIRGGSHLGGGSGGALGALCGVINVIQGESYERTLSCVCWTAYHPRSPFYVLGLTFAIGTLILGFVGVAKWRLPALGPLHLFRDASWGIWALSVITLFYGDQYWRGAFVGVAAAIALHREARPIEAFRIAIPVGIFLVIVALTLARVLRVPGIP